MRNKITFQLLGFLDPHDPFEVPHKLCVGPGRVREAPFHIHFMLGFCVGYHLEK